MDNKKLNDHQLLKHGLDHLAEALCFFYEMNWYAGKQLAVMLDTVIKLGTSLKYSRDPRDDEEEYYPRSNIKKGE
jgi:hypothetical protein